MLLNMYNATHTYYPYYWRLCLLFHWPASALRSHYTYLKTNLTVEKARELLRTIALHTYLPLPIQSKTKIQKVAKILILQYLIPSDRNKIICNICKQAKKMFMKLNSVIMKRFSFLHNLYIHSSLIKKLNSVMGKEPLLVKIQRTFLGLRVEHLYSLNEVTDYKSELRNKRCNDSHNRYANLKILG